MSIVNDGHREQLAEILADLRAKNPDIAGYFRMSKSGGAICFLKPGDPLACMLYSVYIAGDRVVFCEMGGKYPSIVADEVEGTDAT